MSDPTTANYGWSKPVVGADSDTWGTTLNTDLDGIDTDLKAVSDVADAAQVGNAKLTSLAGLTGTANTVPYFASSATFGEFSIGGGLTLATNVLSANVTSVAGHTGAVTLAITDIAGQSGTNTGDQTITLTGDVTGSGSGSFAATVAKIAGVSVGTPTGTGNVVMSDSPTLSGTVDGALTFSGALTLSSALTYGGVTLSNSVTGTGSIVLATSPTFIGTINASTIAATCAAGTTNTVITASGSTTGSAFGQFSNTGANLIWGAESSAGSTLLSGASAYAAVFGNAANAPTQFFANNSLVATCGTDGSFLVGTKTNAGAGAISATGNIASAASLTDAIGNVRSIPQNAQTSAYALVVGDNGKHVSITTGGVTVNSSIFSAGQNVVMFNNSGSSQTITQGSGVTIYLAGTATTGNRTLAQRGLCTLLCIASNTFVISGAGLT